MRRLAGFLLLSACLLYLDAKQGRGRVQDPAGLKKAREAVASQLPQYRVSVPGPGGRAVDVKPTLERVAAGKSLQQMGLPPHDGDGTVFLNLKDREAARRPLPDAPRNYYFEFVVPPPPGIRWPGPLRLIVGVEGEAYYSPDHYRPDSIVPLNRKKP
jgi:guanyl-specific ribonuclease Sa